MDTALLTSFLCTWFSYIPVFIVIVFFLYSKISQSLYQSILSLRDFFSPRSTQLGCCILLTQKRKKLWSHDALRLSFSRGNVSSTLVQASGSHWLQENVCSSWVIATTGRRSSSPTAKLRGETLRFHSTILLNLNLLWFEYFHSSRKGFTIFHHIRAFMSHVHRQTSLSTSLYSLPCLNSQSREVCEQITIGISLYSRLM